MAPPVNVKTWQFLYHCLSQSSKTSVGAVACHSRSRLGVEHDEHTAQLPDYFEDSAACSGEPIASRLSVQTVTLMNLSKCSRVIQERTEYGTAISIEMLAVKAWGCRKQKVHPR